MKTIVVDSGARGAVDATRHSRLRRWRNRATNRALEVVTDPRVRVAVVIGVVAATALFAYFWVVTSRMIDRHLAGDIFDTRSGVYSAPLVLRPGQPLGEDDVLEYVRELGYGSMADENGGEGKGFAGRFAVDGNTISV